MTQLRTSPPSSLAGRDVVYCSDYLKRIRTDRLGNQVGIDLPRSNILAFELDDSSRIIARPSGTEPKIKFYFDVREEIPPGTDFQSAQARANKRLAAIQSDFLAIAQGT